MDDSKEWADRLSKGANRFSTYFYFIRDHYNDPDIGRMGLYTAPAYLITGGRTNPFSQSLFEDDQQPKTNSVDDPNVPPFPNPAGETGS